MLRLHFCCAFVITAACGSGGEDADPDAPTATADSSMPTIDAPPGTAATVVDCASVTPVVDVYYQGDTLTPRTAEIAVGESVRFRDLGSHTAWHDGGLWSASGGETQCVRFDGAGAYSFYCYFDREEDETGTIVVQ